MIKATCVGIVRDYEAEKRARDLTGYVKVNPVIKGYTLKELDENNRIKDGKSYNFSKIDLIAHIESGNIDINNLKIGENNTLETKEVDNDIDVKAARFPDKSTLLGYVVKTLKTSCGHECYLASRGYEHILRIPNNVVAPIMGTGDKSELSIELHKLMGELQVVGGASIVNASELFYECILDKLDLTQFNTQNMEIAYNMFADSNIKEIEFGGHCTMSKVTNMEGMFRCFSGNKLDLNKLNTSSVTNMKNMFENCYCNELLINNIDISKVISMEGMFLDATITELDISKWILSDINNTKYIFKDFEVENEVKLSERDKSNKRIKNFRACWTKEERDAKPKNDWYHQIKKGEKYGYDVSYW